MYRGRINEKQDLSLLEISSCCGDVYVMEYEVKYPFTHMILRGDMQQATEQVRVCVSFNRKTLTVKEISSMVTDCSCGTEDELVTKVVFNTRELYLIQKWSKQALIQWLLTYNLLNVLKTKRACKRA